MKRLNNLPPKFWELVNEYAEEFEKPRLNWRTPEGQNDNSLLYKKIAIEYFIAEYFEFLIKNNRSATAAYYENTR